MSATTTVTAPTQAEPNLVQLRGLIRFEARKLLRQPLFLGFAALTVLFVAIYLGETTNERTGVWYTMLAGSPVQFIPLAAGVLMAANMAASRSHHDGTDDLYGSMPSGASRRVLAQVAAIAWPTAITAGLVGAGIVVSRAWSGLPVAVETNPGTVSVDYPMGSIDATDVTPSQAELIQAPLAVAVFGLIGVVLAVWIRTRIILLVLPVVVMAHLTITSWAIEVPWRWFLPFVSSEQQVGSVEIDAGGTTHSVVQGFNTAAVAWHDLYLVGLLVLLTGLALLRHQRSRPVFGAIGAGGIATTIAGIGQLATYTPSL